MSQETHVCPKQCPEPLVEERLQDEVEYIIAGHSGDRLGRGSPLDDTEQMKQDVAILKAKSQALAEQKAKYIHEMLVLKNPLLQEMVDRLLQESDGYVPISNEDYHRLRNQFFATYPKDVEKREGHSANWEGDLTADGDDAVADAILFERDRYTDMDIYRELYDLDQARVLEKDHSTSEDGGLFAVLNAHASMLAPRKSVPDDIKAAFRVFLVQVINHWQQSSQQG